MRLLQVFANLVENAIKFTPKGGTITVSASVDDDRVVFTVGDDGPGISEDVRRHIFERFQQARETATQGRGLGLYIAKGLVNSHGGEIWAESHVGEGARLRFWIPRGGPAQGRPAPAATGSVLIVDDDEDVRETVRAVLETRGVSVATAANGLDAHELLRGAGTLPRLILLDLHMPVMNGWQLMGELKRSPALAAIPVVIVSSDDGVAAAARALGAQGVLLKPVHVTALLAEVAPRVGLS